VQLLDDRVLLNELRQLERRTGRDKDVICHPSHGHDDCAVSACSALLQCARAVMRPEDFAAGATTLAGHEVRESRDEHLADLGLVDEFDRGSTPFPDDDWRMN
jgi:hypothetical protein